MSYGIFLQRFADGDAAPMDDALGRSLLAPHVVRSRPEHDFVRIRAADGGQADVHTSPGCIMVSRFAAGGILDLVATLAVRLDAVVLLPDGTAVLPAEAHRPHLPPELRAAATTPHPLTGAALLSAIQRT